jgi:GNAT superfamily N-acetyltransferase
MNKEEKTFQVRVMNDGDVSNLISCVIDCYGTTYPKRDLYDFDSLCESVRNGTYSGVVAIDPYDSMLVGHIGWVRHAPTATTVEAGTTMVRPAFRGKGLLKELGTALHNQLKQSGFSGYVHFPTTAHTVMQRASVSSGGAETGLLLGYLPPSLAVRGFTGPRERRLAVTVAYQPLRDAPIGAIGAVSASEAVWLVELAMKLHLPRTVTVRHDEPIAVASQLASSYTASRDLLALTVSTIGRDLTDSVDTATRDRSCLLVHVDLDAADDAAPWARRELASLGFVFGAWLPGWFGSDAMRLQRVNNREVVDLQPELFTSEAKELLHRIAARLS